MDMDRLLEEMMKRKVGGYAPGSPSGGGRYSPGGGSGGVTPRPGVSRGGAGGLMARPGRLSKFRGGGTTATPGGSSQPLSGGGGMGGGRAAGASIMGPGNGQNTPSLDAVLRRVKNRK